MIKLTAQLVNLFDKHHSRMNCTRIILLTLSLLIATWLTGPSANAQDSYIAPIGLGIRGTPDGGGLNLRYFFKDNLSGELQYNLSGGTPNGSGKSSMAVLLFQFHGYLSPNFNFYLGAGAHTGRWQRYKDISKTTSVFGFDLVAGLEYNFSSIPIGISIDAKPSFNYITGVTLFPNNTFGLGVRYYFDIPGLHARQEVDSRE